MPAKLARTGEIAASTEMVQRVGTRAGPAQFLRSGSGAIRTVHTPSTRALKRIAVLRRTSGTALLRRLIAAHVEPRESPSPRKAGDVRSSFVSTSVGRVGAYSPGTKPLGPAFESVPARSEAAPAKPLTILTTVERYRSLEEIGRAIQQGGGITSEELIRWQAIQGHR